MATVNLKDSQGNLRSVPEEQVKDALASGFTQPTQQDISQGELQDQYGTGVGQAKAFAAGAARGATFGLSDQALTKTGLVDPETLENLKTANPAASTTGEFAGIGASLAIPGYGEANAEGRAAAGLALKAAKATGDAEKIAEAAQAVKAAAGVAATPVQALSRIGTGIAEHVAPEAAGIAKTALGLGLGSAAEGAVYGLGQSVSENALGDPDAVGENLFQNALHNATYGAVLGGGAGAGLGLLGGAFSKFFGKEAAQAGSEAAGAAGDAEPAINSALGDAAPKAAADTGTPDLMAGINQNEPPVAPDTKFKLRDDAAKTEEAAKAFGIEAQPSMLTDSSDVHNREGTLFKSPSATGDAVRAPYETATANIKKSFQDILTDGTTGQTPIDIANEARQGMINVVKENAKPTEDLFNLLEKERADISVPQGSLTRFSNQLQELGDKAIDPAAETLLKRTADRVGKITNLSDLKAFRTNLNNALEATASRETKNALYNISDKLDEIQNRTIVNAANKMPEGSIRDAALGLVNDIKNANAQWSGNLSELRAANKALYGVDETLNPKAFAEKLASSLTDEGFITALLDKKNHKAFATLEQIFPDQMASVKKLYRRQILSKATGPGGEFNPAVAARQIVGDGLNGKGMSAEMRAQIFSPEEIKTIEQGDHLLARMTDVKFFNPANTGTHIAYSGYDTAQTAINSLREGRILKAIGEGVAKPLQDIKDSMAYAKLQDQVGKQGAAKVSVLSGLEKQAQQTASKIKSAAVGLFDFSSKLPVGGVGVIHIPTDDEHQKALENVAQYSNNPERLINDLSEHTAELYPYAPNSAGGMQKTAANAVAFMAANAPVKPPKGPLSPKMKPSISEKAIYNNHLMGVKNPFHAMNKLKEGTLLPTDLAAMSAVYPKTLQEQQQAVMSAMVDHITKNGVENIPNSVKVGLSLFLGQDMDPSISPMSVAANQAVLSGAAAQKDQQEAQQKTARISQKGLSSITKSQSMLTNAQQISQRGVES